MSNIDKLKLAIEPYRQQIINHKVYGNIKTVEDIGLFMKLHVYAVWDFMSLLKSLQNELTCTTIPWVPKGSANTRYLINEIVVGEESDVDENGNRISHFELYLKGMQQCGADTTPISNFIALLQQGLTVKEAIVESKMDEGAARFVDFTFDIISSKKTHLLAAVFTFGREDLIPGMFISIINDMDNNFPELVSTFKYYLDRHIEIDGGHHSHLALEMTEQLCGNDTDKWAEAEIAVIEALRMRIYLWDAVLHSIKANNKLAV
jgi:hypothetical protein